MRYNFDNIDVKITDYIEGSAGVRVREVKIEDLQNACDEFLREAITLKKGDEVFLRTHAYLDDIESPRNRIDLHGIFEVRSARIFCGELFIAILHDTETEEPRDDY